MKISNIDQNRESDPARFVYRITIEYDGSEYSGWQRQNNQSTVEAVVRQALITIGMDKAERLTAAGRTDAGAHAHGQVIGCTLPRAWLALNLRDALNSQLPKDVAVVEVARTRRTFHARFDAQERTYRYVVMPRPVRMGISRSYAWRISQNLDIKAMQNAAELLLGKHDFSGLGRAPKIGGSTVRTINATDVRMASLLSQESAVIITVTANAFLYGMMRSIAGLLVGVGQGRVSQAEVRALVLSQGAYHPQFTVAPAQGLHQWRVTYPATVDLEPDEAANEAWYE